MEIDLNKLLLGLGISIALDKIDMNDLLGAVDLQKLITVLSAPKSVANPLPIYTGGVAPNYKYTGVGKFECESCGLVLEFNPVKETEGDQPTGRLPLSCAPLPCLQRLENF